MKKTNYYQIILLTFVGAAYLLYIWGIAQAISFLDNETLLNNEYAELASGFVLNDKLLIAFGVAGFIITLVFFFFDTHPDIKSSLPVKLILSILALAMTVYLLISLISIRDAVFAKSPTFSSNLYYLFLSYKNTALPVMVAQFVLSVIALGRSIYSLVHFFQKNKEEEKRD